MSFCLQDKVIVITGASSGIGTALAQICIQKGAKLVLAARSETRLHELQHQLSALGGQSIVVPTDVTRPSDIDRLIQTTLQKWNRIDILINNAGYGIWGRLGQLPMDEIRKNFETNLFGAIACMQAVIPYFQKQKGGLIVNIESIVALRAMPFSSVYSATKHALHAFSEALRVELASEGIRVLSVCPGLIETPFHQNRVQIGEHIETGPKWLYMPVEKCARQIVCAIEHKRNQVVIANHAKLLAFAQRIAPRFLDWYFIKKY